MESILDDIPNSVYDTFEKVHLLTRHDMHNIKEEFKINANGVMHVNDKISVNKWVENLILLEVRKLTPEIMQSESQVVSQYLKS
ncbi:hypothetical protein CDAR_51571 [Caerostris darwini]|uniref:Uncharacterized protein n=1 Tax=Caerostris darwini TaxID=1538125 RepID=A0AAV4VSA7_9ARAC|nr:hypothetical protein CDAR_51571 [Caerostris darwini]